MPEPWEPWAAAAFAPMAIWGLWRLQTASVELLRLALLRLETVQKWLYSLVSWFGVLIHEMSHAIVLLLTGHGIGGMKVGIEEGHVTPARTQRGAVPFLFFLVAAVAPRFIPPILVLVLLWFYTGGSTGALFQFTSGDDTFAGAVMVLRDLFLDFPVRLGLVLANLDLAMPLGAASFAAFLLFMPSARPSFVKSRYHGEGDEGDLAIVRARIRQRPLPFIVFLGLVYASYFLFIRWYPPGYWIPLQAVWAVALTGVVLAIAGAVLWYLWAFPRRKLASWFGPAVFVAVQIAARLPTDQPPIWAINAAGLVGWAVVAVAFRRW